MKRILSTLALAATLCLPLHAAPPSAQSVHTLAVLAKVDKIRDAVLVQMNRSADSALKQSLAGQEATPADNAVIAACHAQIAVTIDEEMSGDKIRAMYEKVYAETFTQEEIDGLIAFYGSPVGKVFADKVPDLNGKIGVMIQGGLSRVGMKLQGTVIGAMQKIRTAHAPKPIVKPAAAIPVKPATPALPAAPATH